MQKQDQMPEKCLFTFYKQPQHIQTPQQNTQSAQTPSVPPRFSNKKKAKKKIKHHTQLKQKQSCEDLSNPDLTPAKQQTLKKLKSHKKLHKPSRKPISKDQANRNSILPQNNLSVSNKKLNFLSIIGSYNSKKIPNPNHQYQHSVSMVLKPLDKSKILNWNKRNSPTLKKTMISQANMTINPFQKQPVNEEDDYLVNGFESSLHLYTKNSQTKSDMTEIKDQFVQKVKSDVDSNYNQNMKDKFLSKVIRKNLVSDSLRLLEDKKHVSLQKARCLTQHSEQKDSLVGLFHNKQITESFAQQQKSEKSIAKQIKPNQSAKETTHVENMIEKYLRFESKTQELCRQSLIEKGRLWRFSKLTSVHLPEQYQQNFRCQTNSSGFIPAHRSSLAIREVMKTQNSQIFQSYQIYQNYQRLKTKSKKLLRFSMIKNHTTKGIENDKLLREGTPVRETYENHKKEEQQKSKQTFKLPIITNGSENIQKTKPRVKRYDKKLVQNQNKTQQTKQYTENDNQSIQNCQNTSQIEPIKQSHKPYMQKNQCDKSQLDIINQKILTIIETKKRVSKKSQLQNQPQESYNDKLREKSLSTKIIQNFQQKHYRKVEQQRENSRLSQLNLSENFLMKWKESLDWEYKKKLIIKKLGIKI